MPSYPQFAQELQQLIQGSKRILLTMTTGPDGDSIGAMLATCHLLDHFGKQCFCYSPDQIPAMFKYLVPEGQVMRELPDSIHTYDLVIIFDTGDIKRTPLADDLKARPAKKPHVVNIDHHPTVIEHQGVIIVDTNFIDTKASSTTEMLHKLLEHLNVPLNRHLATGLLTGILTDTGHFTNMATTIDAMTIAAQLMAKGADHRTITQATMRNKSLGTLKLWGRALSRLNHDPDSGVVSTVLTLHDFAECGVDAKATTGISNFLNNLGEGKIALVLHEEPGNIIKGSLRTTTPGVNVAEFAESFGGGGHPKAAGFKVHGRLVETKMGWRIQQ